MSWVEDGIYTETSLIRECKYWLPRIAIAGLIIRLIIAFSRIDLEWPDEQFQTLEPASKAVFGYGLMSWEWKVGYRSWLLPGLYMPLFFLFKWFGITGGKVIILGSRVFTALVSSWVIFRFNQVLKFSAVSALPRIVAVSAFSFSVPMILWSCTTLGDHWAMIACWVSLPEILNRIESRDSKNWFWIGSLISLPALIKFQMMFWTLGVGLAFVLIRVPLKLLFWVILGCLGDFFFLGALDQVTWGKPFQSIIEQVTNGRAIAKLHGVSPWWDYFLKLLDNQGKFFFPVFLVFSFSTA